MAKIIALVGLSSAGKDTAALAMQQEFINCGKEARLGSFADPIRKISKAVGLEPYDRGLKEKRKDFLFSDFDALVFDAIESVLGNFLSDDDRALLYTFTIDSLEPFKYDDAGDTRISISPREFMQYLGTEGGQRVRKLLWVELAKNLWDTLPGIVICTDCRFSHETWLIDRMVLIIRSGLSRINEHPSEDMAEAMTNGISPALHRSTMLRIYNDSTKERFEEACRVVAEALAKGAV